MHGTQYGCFLLFCPMSSHESNPFLASYIVTRKHVHRYALCSGAHQQHSTWPKTFFGLLNIFSALHEHKGVYSEFWEVCKQWCHNTVLAVPRWPPILSSTSRVQRVRGKLSVLRWTEITSECLYKYGSNFIIMQKSQIRKFRFSGTWRSTGCIRFYDLSDIVRCRTMRSLECSES